MNENDFKKKQWRTVFSDDRDAIVWKSGYYVRTCVLRYASSLEIKS